jgi:hypothetical protein
MMSWSGGRIGRAGCWFVGRRAGRVVLGLRFALLRVGFLTCGVCFAGSEENA